MTKIILVTFVLIYNIIAQADINSELNLIRNRTINWAETYRLSGDSPRKSVAEYLALLKPNGNFSDKDSKIDIMTSRLLLMAQAFKTDPKWKGNLHLKTNLYSAIQYWLDHNPGNGGWVAGAFHEPSSMDAIGLCLYDAIQSDKTNFPSMVPKLNALMDGMIHWANYAWSQNNYGEFFAGANISYRLMGMIGRAALAGSPDMFNDIKNIVASTFKIGEAYDYGRFADGSWHQHNVSGGQNYWIGYGSDWLYLTRKCCAYLKGTRWGLTDAQLNILADGILDGWQWQIYRNQGVYSLGGRHNLVKNALRDNSFVIGQIDLLRQLAGEENLFRNDELEITKNRLKNSSMEFSSFNKTKYFYNSDLMICGKPFSYVVTKMISNRTAGPESGSGRGKLNYHFGEGSTLIFKTGNEYQNARVAWNFRAIPGITAEQKTDDLPNVDFGLNLKSFNFFAGGVSDGKFGLCAFQLQRANDYSKVTANKSYFFFENGFAALGSKIRKRPPYLGNEIWTTIDQPERKTDISYFINGKKYSIPLSSNVQLNFTNITDGAWFYCNGNGYVILSDKNGVNLKLWAENRTGDWHRLDVRHREGDLQSVNIFQLSINHFTKPKNAKYAYLVFPNITEEKLNNYFKNSPVKILENSETVQAVQFLNSNITEIVFYKADSIVLNSPFLKGAKGDLKSGLTISVNKPAIVMLKKNDNQLNMSIADPNQFEEKIVMTINAKLEASKNIIYNPKTENSKITFFLPQGIYLGKNVTQSQLIQLSD